MCVGFDDVETLCSLGSFWVDKESVRTVHRRPRYRDPIDSHALVGDSSFIYIFQPEPPRDNHDEGHTLMKPCSVRSSSVADDVDVGWR